MGGHLLKSLLFRLVKIKRAWGRPPKPPAVLHLCVEPVKFDLRDPTNWLIQLKKQEGTRDEIIDGYIKLVAKVLGSEEEAREKIYAVSTKYYFAIRLAVSEEVANKFKKLSEVITVLNVDRDSRFGNGEPFVNGKPVPYDPKYHAFYFRVQVRIRAGRLADGRSVEEIDRKIAEAGMTIEEVEQKFCNPVDVESGWKSDMSDDEESDGMSDGSQSYPHVESSDSEQPSAESEIESSESDDDVEDFSNINDAEFTIFVDAFGNKNWVPKCDVKQKPYTNQYFTSLEDAYDFYWKHGKLCNFDVRKSTKKSNAKGKLSARYIQCNRGGSPYHGRSKRLDENGVNGAQKKTTSRRCNCKARIIMKPAGPKGFVVMSFIEEHNHPLATGAAKMFLRCNRNLSVVNQNFIMDCARANVGATRSHALAKEMVGSYEDIGATVIDFKNFARDVKVRIGDKDADMILAKFKLKKETSNDTFYYDYKVDKDGHLTGLFWSDAIGQANFDVFGDIVSFDPTFRTNRYNMVFVPFTGVDNHWKNVTFAAGLLAKENYKNFKWLLLAFKKAMGRVPPCVITDQCPAIKKALDKWWSKAKHRFCMWHIMNKLPSKVGPILSSNKKFVEKLKSAVYSDHFTPTEFEECWHAVISEYKLENNVWLTELFNIRHQWIPAYFSDIEMAGLLRTTSRSESSNFFFQHFHESGDTLVEFYSSFESAMDKQRLRYAEDEKKSQQIPLTDTTLPIEKDASKWYTLEIYYLVREEIKTACFHTSMPDMTRENDTRIFKCKDDLLHDKIFEVNVRLSDNYVQCSCKLFFRKGYLCRHAFAALHQCSVKRIPKEFVKPRWSKNAVKRHSFLGSSKVTEICEAQDRKKLKRTRAWFEFHNCMNVAGEDEDKLDSIITGVQSINAAITQSTDNTPVQGGGHRADKFISLVPESEISVFNPNKSRNKGCGSRIKSRREIAIETGKGRQCSRCKVIGHNARTCTGIKESG